MNKLETTRSSLWVALVLGVAFCTLFFTNWGYPIEDAAMIFAYSQNIAAGDGIVYVPGGERVDGASDLLFTFALAALARAGLPIQFGAGLLNAVGLGVIVILIFKIWSKIVTRNYWPAFAAVIVFLLTTPVFFLGASGFGTLAFSALIAIAAYLAVKASATSSTTSLALLGISVALAGMNRIEGFVLAGLTVLAQSVALKSWRIVVIPGLTAALIAGAWFSWRWSYFGYPLPNPFYKKAGIYLGSAIIALRAVIEFTAPWLPILATGLLCAETRRRAASYILLVVLPWAGIWVFLSNEMNVANRFQFPLAPVLAILCGSLAASLLPFLQAILKTFNAANRIRRNKSVVATGVAVLVLVGGSMTLALSRQSTRLAGLHSATFHQEVADAIGRSKVDSEIVATSEAGMVAWRSGVRVVDIWGLNDKRIAHEGPLSPEELAKLNPQIIYSHLGKPEILDLPASGMKNRSWERTNVNLFCFAERSGYAPAAVWTRGELNDWWVVLAKAGTPLLDRLRAELSTVELAGDKSTIDVSIPRVRDCPRELAS